MVRQDHPGAEPVAHRAIIGMGGCPQPDHRHAKPQFDRDKPAAAIQSRLRQRMPRKMGRAFPVAPVFGKSGLQQAIHRLPGQLIHDHPGERRSTFGDPATPARPPAGEQGQGLLCSDLVPSVCQPQHMRRVRRRDPRQHHLPPPDHPGKRGVLHPAGDRLGQGQRAIRKPCGNRGLARIKARRQITLPVRQHDLAAVLRRDLLRQRVVQHVMHQCGMVHRRQRNRHDPARPKAQPAIEPFDHMHRTVATKARGAHRHRLDHGAERPHPRALWVDLGAAILQQANIRRRAADIADQRGRLLRQPLCPRDGCRRAAQDRFNRLFAGHVGRDQRPVTPHDHQTRGDPQSRQMPLTGRNQPVDHSDKPRIQHRRQRAFRTAQGLAQIMRTAHRFASDSADHVTRGNLMRRIACGETGGHGETGDPRRQIGERLLQCVSTERHSLCPGMGMTA